MSSFKFSTCTYAKLFIRITVTLYFVILIVLPLSVTGYLIRAAVGIPARRWSNPRYRPGHAM